MDFLVEAEMDVKEAEVRSGPPNKKICPERSEKERFLSAVGAALEATEVRMVRESSIQPQSRLEAIESPGFELTGRSEQNGLNWLSSSGQVVRLGHEIMSVDDFLLIYGAACCTFNRVPDGWNLCDWWGRERCENRGVEFKHVGDCMSYLPRKWHDLHEECVTLLWEVADSSNGNDKFERGSFVMYRKGDRRNLSAYFFRTGTPLFREYHRGSVKLDMNALQFDLRRRRVYRRMYHNPYGDGIVCVEFDQKTTLPEKCHDWIGFLTPCCPGWNPPRAANHACCQPAMSRWIRGYPLVHESNRKMFEELNVSFHSRCGDILYTPNLIMMEFLFLFLSGSGSDVLELIAMYLTKRELELLVLPLRYYMGCHRTCDRNIGEMLLRVSVSDVISPFVLFSRKVSSIITPIGIIRDLSTATYREMFDSTFIDCDYVYEPLIGRGPIVKDRFPRWRVALLTGLLNDLNERKERDMKIIAKGFQYFRYKLAHAIQVLTSVDFNELGDRVVESWPFESRLFFPDCPEPLRRRSVISAAGDQAGHEREHIRLLKSWKFIYYLGLAKKREKLACEWLWANASNDHNGPIHGLDKVHERRLIRILSDLIDVEVSKGDDIGDHIHGFAALVFLGIPFPHGYEMGSISEQRCSCYEKIGMTLDTIQSMHWNATNCSQRFLEATTPQNCVIRGIYNPGEARKGGPLAMYRNRPIIPFESGEVRDTAFLAGAGALSPNFLGTPPKKVTSRNHEELKEYTQSWSPGWVIKNGYPSYRGPSRVCTRRNLLHELEETTENSDAETVILAQPDVWEYEDEFERPRDD